MTRINLIPPSELSDQHLIAEYRELPRVLKQDINITNAPDRYCLGAGHVKWAKKHDLFTGFRYFDIVCEMQYRGFKTRDYDEVLCVYNKDYDPDEQDIETNRARLREKYHQKPEWYRWTNRTKPAWL